MTFIPDQQLVFIDSGVEDRSVLIQGLPLHAHMVVIQAGSDGLEQIAAVMAGRSGVASLHLICHGGPGALLLGGAHIERAQLPRHAQALATIGAAMRDDGQWLIYACDVAGDASGRRFVDALADHAGVRVAAASHKVGSADLGASWELDYAPHGQRQALDVAHWNGVLMAAPTLFLPSTVTLGTATSYAVGGTVYGLALADMNGDGKLDLLATSYSGNTVALMLNTGNGTFGPRAEFSTGGLPRSLTVGDFNNDGKLDLASVGIDSTNVSVLLGDGSGGFGGKQDYPLGSSSQSIVSVDVNGDTKLDLLVADRDSASLSVLIGTGNGAFKPRVDYVTGVNPTSAIVALLDGDNKYDLVNTNGDANTISVRLATDWGVFGPAIDYPTGLAPSAVKAGDFNHDNKIDLIVANVGGKSVSVLLGKDDGTFSNRLDYAIGATPRAIALADINGDGHTDVIAANESDGKLTLLLGTGTGTFTGKTEFATSGSPASILSEDLDGDGKPDLIVGDGTQVVVQLSSSSLTSSNVIEQTPGSATPGIVINDPDGDADWNGGKLTLVLWEMSTVYDRLAMSTVQPADSGIWIDNAGNKLMAGATQIGTANVATTIAGHALEFTFNANATSALVQATARAVQFNNIRDDPDQWTRWLNVDVFDKHGSHAQLRQPIRISAVNDAPLIGNLPATAQGVTVGVASELDDFTVNDPDAAGTILSVTLTPTNGSIGGVSDADPARAGIQLAGNAAQINSALAQATFSAAAAGAAGIGISVSDALAPAVSASYPLMAGNTAPTIAGLPAAPQAVFPGAAAALDNFTVDDVNGDTLSVTLTALNGAIDGLSDADGAAPGIQLSGSAAAINSALAGATFTATELGAASIGISVSDGLAAPVSATYAMIGMNAAPIVLLPTTLALASAWSMQAIGLTPTAVALADVNGDGKPDLVTSDSGGVSVLLAGAAGTFGARTSYAMPSRPTAIASADFNGDGKLDLVSANYQDGGVTVLLNNGTGSFPSQVQYATGNSPLSVIGNDVNGDGKADLIVANRDSLSISVLLGNGDGTFPNKTDHAIGASPYSVGSADLNGDGKLDLFVANGVPGTKSVSVLLNDGAGNFAPEVRYRTGDSPTSVIGADVNGDGMVDLVTANWVDNSVSVLLGAGDGTFGTNLDIPVGQYPKDIASADINGDGKPDLITGNLIGNSISVLLGNGSGTFSSKQDFTAGIAIPFFSAADLDGDGKAELIVANAGAQAVSVLHDMGGVGATAFTEQTAVAASAALQVSDSNGSAEWNGGSLRVQITANNDSADSLSIATANPGGSAIWVDTAGNKLMAGTLQIGSASAATVANGGALTFHFTGNASNTLVQETARAVQFNNSADAPSLLARGLTFTATDTHGASAKAVQTITIAAVNDAPGVSGVPATAQQVTVGVAAALADFTVADPDSAILTATLTSTNGSIIGLVDADAVLAGIQLTGTAASINSAIAGARFSASGAGTASIGVSVSDGLAAPAVASYTLQASANHAPTIGGLPAGLLSAVLGTAAHLPALAIGDADGNLLTLTVTAVNGTLAGLADANPALPGIQLSGTPGALGAALSAATFSGAATGAASIGLALSDGVAAPVTATLGWMVAPAPVPEPPVIVKPVPATNVNGISDAQENAVPGLAVPGRGPGVTGDGNGDGVQDSQQANVASAPFAPASWITLVASPATTLGNVRQLDAPATLPAGMNEPLGQLAFNAAVRTVGATEKFSLYVDPALGVNGFWSAGKDGVWVNLASAVQGGAVLIEGNKMRLDFSVTDGGRFDADGQANGSISVTGAPGFMELSIVGQGATAGAGAHFW